MVIPMIFTLAEDALSSVPHSMTAASMALGASRWQTLWRVVLPSASPGIFAAVMIGFGRAVGETMVFLMATGNTPLIDLSPFNGMRTLSANIAEEIPGAPLNGTLYRTLFLCAVILFIMTFFLNTIAEVVRQRLRKRYGSVLTGAIGHGVTYALAESTRHAAEIRLDRGPRQLRREQSAASRLAASPRAISSGAAENRWSGLPAARWPRSSLARSRSWSCCWSTAWRTSGPRGWRNCNSPTAATPWAGE